MVVKRVHSSFLELYHLFAEWALWLTDGILPHVLQVAYEALAVEHVVFVAL